MNDPLDLFSILRIYNLYLMPAGPPGWYVGNWDEDWDRRDDESPGRTGQYGDTPEMAVQNWLLSNP